MPPALRIELTQRALIGLVGLLIGSGGVGTYALKNVGTNYREIEARLVRVESDVAFLVRRELNADLTQKREGAKLHSVSSVPSVVKNQEEP